MRVTLSNKHQEKSDKTAFTDANPDNKSLFPQI